MPLASWASNWQSWHGLRTGNRALQLAVVPCAILMASSPPAGFEIDTLSGGLLWIAAV